MNFMILAIEGFNIILKLYIYREWLALPIWFNRIKKCIKTNRNDLIDKLY